jgi:hypothetical protein
MERIGDGLLLISASLDRTIISPEVVPRRFTNTIGIEVASDDSHFTLCKRIWTDRFVASAVDYKARLADSEHAPAVRSKL